MDKYKKLPKWAQEEINALKNHISSLENQIAEMYGEKETNNWFIEGPREMHPLPKDTTVRFQIGDDYVECHLTQDGLRVSAWHDRIKIMPLASNSFHVKTER